MKTIFSGCFVSFGLLFMTFSIHAQDGVIQNLQKESATATKKSALPSDTNHRWQKGLLYNLNFSQSSLTNWSAGGDKFSMSINSILNIFAKYAHGKNSWDNTFDFNLGYVNSTSLGARKNDDRFDLVSKYGRSINPKTNLAFLGNIRSGFLKGYSYTTAGNTLISNFMSPGYVLTSAGLDFKPSRMLSVFFSPATARWVLVTDPVLSAKGLYGVKAGQTSILEVGSFATVNFMKDIAPNIVYKSKLDLFSNYRHKALNVDLFMTNLLSIKLSKLFTMSWAVDMIYDDDAKLFGPKKSSPALQFKSLIGLGVQIKR
jgi:hypothetical protein